MNESGSRVATSVLVSVLRRKSSIPVLSCFAWWPASASNQTGTPVGRSFLESLNLPSGQHHDELVLTEDVQHVYQQRLGVQRPQPPTAPN